MYFFYEPVHAQFYRINTCDCTHIYYSNFTYFIYIKINAHYDYCNSVIREHFVKMSGDNECLKDFVTHMDASAHDLTLTYPVRSYVVGCDAPKTANILFGTDILHLGRCKQGAKAEVISNKGKNGDNVLCDIDANTYQLKVEVANGKKIDLTDKIPFSKSTKDEAPAQQIMCANIQTIRMPAGVVVGTNEYPSTYSPICNFVDERTIGNLFDIYSLSEGEPIEVKIL